MKAVVVIPTYNESENIRSLIKQILKLGIKNLEILVVDDNSPDKTWKIVEDIGNKKVNLLLRKKDKGRGRAGAAGFKKALDMGADFIIEMDADFSHNPRYIPTLLKKMNEADVVLGSRAVKGGKDVGRPKARLVITKFANLYIKILLGLDVKDCNSGYRCFRREVLEKINPDKIMSKGPAIVQEVLFKAHLKGFKICEIPITFKEREKGNSKLGVRQLYQGYLMVLRLLIMHAFGRI